MSEEKRPRIKVECYAGYRGEETPLRFYLGERCIEVKEVLDRWFDPACSYFKLSGDDDDIYILRHVTCDDTWELTVYDGRGKSGLA